MPMVPFDNEEIIKYFDSCADPNWKILLYGPTGTGKTTFMADLLIASKCRFDEVFVICNTYAQDVYDLISFRYNRFYSSALASKKRKKDEEAAAIERTKCVISDLARICYSTADKKYRVLLILDDIPETVFSNNKEFSTLIRISRHNNISIIFITHDIIRVESSLRNEFDVFMLTRGKFTIPHQLSQSAWSMCKELNVWISKNKLPSNYIAMLMMILRDGSTSVYAVENNIGKSPIHKALATNTRLIRYIYTKKSYYFHMRYFDENLINTAMNETEIGRNKTIELKKKTTTKKKAQSIAAIHIGDL